MTSFAQILPFAIWIWFYGSYDTGQLGLWTPASGLSSIACQLELDDDAATQYSNLHISFETSTQEC